jgi:DNA primase large subunit
MQRKSNQTINLTDTLRLPDEVQERFKKPFGFRPGSLRSGWFPPCGPTSFQ